jgi:hypothetical protein
MVKVLEVNVKFRSFLVRDKCFSFIIPGYPDAPVMLLDKSDDLFYIERIREIVDD